jgi:hypothetical protein
MSDVEEERTPPLERRSGTGERRRYNRRSTSEVTPPYFETFERIADALEGIRDELAKGQATAEPRSAAAAPAPRGAEA